MLAQETEIIDIDSNQVYDAKVLASNLSTEQVRKRALIDYLGIICANHYLGLHKIRTETRRSIHKVPFLFEEFKISDLYYGNYRIDTITLYKEKTIKIPKIHVDMEILPDFYLVIQIGSKIKEAKIIGFISAQDVLKCSHDSKFYYPTLDMLIDLNKFYALTRTAVAPKVLLGKHIDCLGMFLKFIDNNLSSVYKTQLIRHLMNCDSCRARFVDVMEFEKLAKNIHYYPKLMRKCESAYNNENIVMQTGPRVGRNVSLEEALSKKSIEDDEFEIVEKDDSSSKQYHNSKIDAEINSIYPVKLDTSNEKIAQMFDIKEKVNKLGITKKIISIIFNEISKIEFSKLKEIVKEKNKRKILISVVVFFVIASFALISINTMSDSSQEDNDYDQLQAYNENTNEDSLEFDLPYSNGKAKLIPNQKSVDDYSIDESVSNKPAYSPNISRVAWEVPQELTKNDAFSKYLKMIGKNIKLNLQNDLLLVNDVPTNKNAKIEIVFATDGSIINIDTYQSSGSGVIDQTIQRTVQSTLRYMKPPTMNLSSEQSIILNVDML